MASSMRHQVTRLTTIAFHTMVKESFNRSGAFDAMVEFVHSRHYVLRFKNLADDHTDGKLKAYYDRVNALLKKVLHMDYLPKHLSIELGNCIIEHQKHILQLANFLSSSLQFVTLENIRALCECIVLTPDGVLDKRKTVLNAVASTKVIGFRFTYMAGYFGVSQERAIQEYEGRIAEGKNCAHIRAVYSNFTDPQQTWEERLRRERMSGLFYEGVCIHGPREALEYFFYDNEDPDNQQIELSKAAACIEHHDVSVDKILFFRKHMDPPAWRTVLKRCFYKIFYTFFKSYRYKHMCATLYSEVCDSLEPKVIFSCLDAMITRVIGAFWYPMNMAFLLADFEPTFLSVWHLIPSYKKHIGSSIYRILKTLLRYKMHNIVVALVKDEEAFTENFRKELIGCAVMFMIVNNQQDTVLDFLKMIGPETYDMNRIKEELITPENLNIFIAFVDCCVNMRNYDHLLQFKYSTEFSVEVAKRCLLFKDHFNQVILLALRQGHVSAERFETFLYWVFNNNSSQVDQYVKNCQQPPNLLSEIYKHYMTSTRRSIYTIPAFQQSDEETQKIRRKIATDTETLRAYCYALMLSKDYSALPRMLTSAFTHEAEREAFLTGFFLSRQGLQSIYRMLMSPSYDINYFCRFIFKDKLKEFREFKKHWIITPRISAVLELIMNGYGRAQLFSDGEGENNDEENEEVQLDILPHESVEEFSRVCDANIAIFKCVLRDSFIVEMFHVLANHNYWL